jgi:hypothetical protein
VKVRVVCVFNKNFINSLNDYKIKNNSELRIPHSELKTVTIKRKEVKKLYATQTYAAGIVGTERFDNQSG